MFANKKYFKTKNYKFNIQYTFFLLTLNNTNLIKEKKEVGEHLSDYVYSN